MVLDCGPSLGLPQVGETDHRRSILTVPSVPVTQIHALPACNVVGRLGTRMGVARGHSGPERFPVEGVSPAPG